MSLLYGKFYHVGLNKFLVQVHLAYCKPLMVEIKTQPIALHLKAQGVLAISNWTP